jgi:hypothetical protein
VLRPTDDEQRRAAKFRDALCWPTPRCHLEANQVADGRILPINEFFNLCYCASVGLGQEGHENNAIKEDIRALDVPMFWWMQDGPYLVQAKVHPESHTQLFSAYNSCQRVFDFRTGEWDIYGGWGLAGVNARQCHVMQLHPPLKLVDPDNCVCGAYKMVGSHRVYMQDLDEDQQLFDEDRQMLDKINSSQGMDLQGIEGCFASVLFGISPTEQQQLQANYKRTLKATGNVVFEELRKLSLTYIGSPSISLQYRYGLKHPSRGSSQLNLSVHWKNDGGSDLMPYNLRSLSRIISSQGSEKDWCAVDLPIACDYV